MKLAGMFLILSVLALLIAFLIFSRYPSLAAEAHIIQTNLDDRLVALSSQLSSPETLQQAKKEIAELETQQANVELAQHKVSSQSTRTLLVAMGLFAAGVVCVRRSRTARTAASPAATES